MTLLWFCFFNYLNPIKSSIVIERLSYRFRFNDFLKSKISKRPRFICWTDISRYFHSVSIATKKNFYHFKCFDDNAIYPFIFMTNSLEVSVRKSFLWRIQKICNGNWVCWLLSIDISNWAKSYYMIHYRQFRYPLETDDCSIPNAVKWFLLQSLIGNQFGNSHSRT